VFAQAMNVVNNRMWRSIALDPQWATLGRWLDAERRS